MRLWVKVFVSRGWVQGEITVHTLQFTVNLISFRAFNLIGLANLSRFKTGKTAII